MSTINENKSSNFLRTQSYIANGMPNPTFKASKKDYLANLVKNKYEKKPSKAKVNKNKNYINNVKRQKKLKKNSFNKTSQKKLLKKYINDKLEEKTEIIKHKNCNTYSRNAYVYNTKTEKFKNINENYLYSKIHHYTIKDNNNKESKGKENNKNALNNRDKKFYVNNRMKTNNDFNKSNGLHKSNTFSNNLTDDFFSKTTKGRNNFKCDFSDIVNQTKLGIMTTRANMNQSKNKAFRKDFDGIYNMTYRSKKKKNPKILNSEKFKNIVNKVLSNNKDDYLDIKNHKNKNKLLNKLNHYAKREKMNFEENNKTQNGLLTIKQLINKKIMLFSPKITNNKIYNIPTNLFHSSYSNYKQYHEYLNNYSNKTNSKINRIEPVLTEYNNKHNKKDDSNSDLFKIQISKSLSNIINSIREQRKTSKFIKDLNKNISFGNKSNNNKFTFSPKDEQDSCDEFYSPNKSKFNNIQYKDIKNLNNKKKINYFIKKNISSDNFRRNSKKKYNKINCNDINIRINNFINTYNDKKHFVLPVNHAIN